MSNATTTSAPSVSTFQHDYQDAASQTRFAFTITGAGGTYVLAITNTRTKDIYLTNVQNHSLVFNRIKAALSNQNSKAYIVGVSLSQDEQQLTFRIEEPDVQEYELVLDKQVSDEVALLKQRVRDLEDEVAKLKPKFYAYAATGSHPKLTGSDWQNVDNKLTDTPLELHGRPLKLFLNYSALASVSHGGLRIQLTNVKTSDAILLGEHLQYGLDWVCPIDDWTKSSIIRVFPSIPAGRYLATVQARAQQPTSTIEFHGGDPSTGFSGFHVIYEEM